MKELDRVAIDFQKVIKKSFQPLFDRDKSFDYKKEPYPVIAYYQAANIKKIELVMSNLLIEIKTLNTNLVNINGQMKTNTDTIVAEIKKLPQAHDHIP